MSLEERVLLIEQDLAILKSRLNTLPSVANSGANEVASAGENPWLEGAGMLSDDPLFDDWQDAIAEYRREVDANPDAP